MARLPHGDATIVATDIEGSTRLQRRLGPSYADVLAHHDTLLDLALARNGGTLVYRAGDGMVASFPDPASGLRAALTIQAVTASTLWPGQADVRLRIGVHAGGAGAERLALAVMAAGHGGQVLCSRATLEAAALGGDGDVPARALGTFRLLPDASGDAVELVQVGDLAEHPAPRAVPVAAHNLPRMLTRFIGREQERAELSRLLEERRLVTVVGPGGVGKTRLAFEVVSSCAAQWSGGAWVVLLAGVAPGEVGVNTRVAAAVGASRSIDGNTRRALADRLAGAPALLLLDNAEHLVDEVSEVVRALLADCPLLTVVVTSREPLRLPGEHVWRLQPMTVPDRARPDDAMGCDAVRLFLDRSGGAVVDPPDAAGALFEICRRLDGLPLAIELAAARATAIPLPALLKTLGDDLDVAGQPGAVESRHRTLTATLQWSHDLLGPAEQVLFRRLGVFRAPFTLEAAEAVCGGEPLAPWEVLDLLGELLDKSLVSVADDGDEARTYRMLASVRRFAELRLLEAGEEDLVRAAHLQWVVAELTAVPPRATARNLTAELTRISDIADEATAALELAYAMHDVESVQLIATRLARRTFIKALYGEGLAMTQRALALPGGSDLLRAWLWFRESLHLGMLNRFDEAEAAIQQMIDSPACLADPDVGASAWHTAGDISFRAGDLVTAVERYGIALSLVVDEHERMLLERSSAECAPDDPDAPDTLRRVIDYFRAVDNDFELARSLASLALVLWRQGGIDGELVAGESVTLSQQLGAHGEVVSGLWLLAAYRLRAGDPQTARRLVERLRRYERQHGLARDQVLDEAYARVLGDSVEAIRALELGAIAGD